MAGRAAVLVAAAAFGARLLSAGTSSVPWRRLDVVVGCLFIAASMYYAYRVLSGGIATRLPGETGSNVLP